MPFKDPEKRKAYLAKYYEKNRESLRNHRADKYSRDEKFREAQRERSRRHYWLTRRPTRIEKKAESLVETPTLTPVAIVTVRIDCCTDVRFGQDVEVPVFTSAAVAALLRRSAETVRAWEAKGVLPAPAYRSADLPAAAVRGKNARLYTQDELAIFAEAVHLLALPSRGLVDSPFSKKVKQGFKELLVRGIRREPM